MCIIISWNKYRQGNTERGNFILWPLEKRTIQASNRGKRLPRTRLSQLTMSLFFVHLQWTFNRMWSGSPRRVKGLQILPSLQGHPKTQRLNHRDDRTQQKGGSTYSKKTMFLFKNTVLLVILFHFELPYYNNNKCFLQFSAQMLVLFSWNLVSNYLFTCQEDREFSDGRDEVFFISTASEFVKKLFHDGHSINTA